nr:cytochrome c-type biogenesis protein [Rhizobium tropici]
MNAFAVNPDEVLPDPALEARARTISAELRCMVCQNQSIDDSNADLARDLRLLVRKRLTDGDTDQQVLDYIVSRYGEFVLLKPRLSEKTYILWGAPIALLVTGGLALAVYARRRAGKPTGSSLNADEEAQLKDILGK